MLELTIAEGRSVCPSVCPSVTLVISKSRLNGSNIEILVTPYERAMFLIFGG